MSSVLARPGHADEQTMPARQKGHHQLFNNLLLADNHLADFLEHNVAGLVELFERVEIGRHRQENPSGLDLRGGFWLRRLKLHRKVTCY
jgi:hypothetical protein